MAKIGNLFDIKQKTASFREAALNIELQGLILVSICVCLQELILNI